MHVLTSGRSETTVGGTYIQVQAVVTSRTKLRRLAHERLKHFALCVIRYIARSFSLTV